MCSDVVEEGSDEGGALRQQGKTERGGRWLGGVLGGEGVVQQRGGELGWFRVLNRKEGGAVVVQRRSSDVGEEDDDDATMEMAVLMESQRQRRGRQRSSNGEMTVTQQRGRGERSS